MRCKCQPLSGRTCLQRTDDGTQAVISVIISEPIILLSHSFEWKCILRIPRYAIKKATSRSASVQWVYSEYNHFRKCPLNRALTHILAAILFDGNTRIMTFIQIYILCRSFENSNGKWKYLGSSMNLHSSETMLFGKYYTGRPSISFQKFTEIKISCGNTRAVFVSGKWKCFEG